MFKPESWQSHDEYQTIITTFGRRLSRNNPRYHFDLYSKEYHKLLNLDLDPLRDYLANYFSPIGRPAKNQAQILRSLILFVLLFNTPLPGPVSLPGFLMSFPIPFPWPSSVAFPPQTISRLSARITIS